MLNFLVTDRNGYEERFVTNGNNADEDRMDFADILEQFMGKDAKETYTECVEGSDEHIESMIENAVIEAEERCRLELDNIVCELDAILDMFDGRMNKEKTYKAIKYLRDNIWKNM